MKIVKIILSTLLTLIIVGAVGAGLLYVHLKSDLPDVATLKTVELQQPMQIYTADGKLIGEVGEQRRIPVKLEDIPQVLIDAVLATEDTRFYEHKGIDPKGLSVRCGAPAKAICKVRVPSLSNLHVISFCRLNVK